MRVKKIGVVCAVGGLLVGFGAGWIGKGHLGASAALLGHSLRANDSTYTFVKPLLACNVDAAAEPDSLNELKDQFTQDINDAIRNDRAQSVSVYFKNVNRGDWTSVNADALYTPASLSKVPLLIAALKQAEGDPNFLSRVLEIKTVPSAQQEQEVPPEEMVEAGKSYSIEDLLRLMIVDSDNRATRILMSTLDQEILKEVFTDLEIPAPDGEENYTISTRAYARFFRILYNGTFLSPAMSEKALALLADAKYDQALSAGVDAQISIAHKFGEIATQKDDGTVTRELHDCGIVYTNEPYALCVMTIGTNLQTLESVIADISKTAYEFKKENP